MSNVDVSVVMCTCNRAAMLPDALESLFALRADGFSFEIIVVDNASKDDTGDVVRSMIDRSPVPLRVVYESTPGGAYAHNRGIEAAAGEWIAWFDDDELADPNWLNALMTTARRRNVQSVGGAVKLHFQDGRPHKFGRPVRRLLGESNGWTDERPYTRKEGPGSGNQLLHKSVFGRIGGYDVAYNQRGYDTDLYRRIREAGYESWYTPDAIVMHVTPPSRLQIDYIRRTCWDNGWCFAKRDLVEWGRGVMWGITFLRMGHAAAWHVPRLVKSRLLRDRIGALDARCELWRAQGYFRTAFLPSQPGRVLMTPPVFDGCAAIVFDGLMYVGI